MKKRKVELSRKLALNKEWITRLNAASQSGILGGATAKDCADDTLQYSCTGQSTCGIACTVIDCVSHLCQNTKPPVCELA